MPFCAGEDSGLGMWHASAVGPGARVCTGLVVVAMVVGVAAGCGGGRGATQEPGAAEQALEQREAGMRRVVRAWSSRVNAGDNRGVARLFKVPVIMRQGPYAYRLATAGEVALWHRGLPCSGLIESVTVEGRVATVVFVLGDRVGSQCDAPGARVAARFEIVGGRIVSWEQVPVPPEQEVAPAT